MFDKEKTCFVRFLFDLILYVPVNNFSFMSGWESALYNVTGISLFSVPTG